MQEINDRVDIALAGEAISDMAPVKEQNSLLMLPQNPNEWILTQPPFKRKHKFRII